MHPGGLRKGIMDRLAAAWEDPGRRARLLRYLWLISSVFTVFGFAVMFYLIWSSR